MTATNASHTERSAAFIARELKRLYDQLSAIAAHQPGKDLHTRAFQLTALGVAFANTIASYDPAVQAAYWLRSEARVLRVGNVRQRDTLNLYVGYIVVEAEEVERPDISWASLGARSLAALRREERKRCERTAV